MESSKLVHWSSQIVPPLLCIFIFSTHGPGMWFLLGIPLFCLLISVISLSIKLFNYKKNKIYIVRPLLTIFIALLLFSIATTSYNIAKIETIEIAKKIEEECKLKSICPKNIKDWHSVSNFGDYKTKVGGFITYPLFYTYKEKEFSLYLYQSLDMGDTYTGGVNLDLNSSFD